VAPARPLILLCLLAFAGGCGAAPPKPQVVDGSVVLEDGGTAPLMEVGTGVNGFEPLVDGQKVPIIAGPQGGHHVWVAVRVRAPMDPKNLFIHLRLLHQGTALSPTDYRMTLVRRGNFHEVYGMMALVPDPAAIDGQEVQLVVEVTDSAGLTATDSRRIIPQAP
jgi:hypothetical protein